VSVSSSVRLSVPGAARTAAAEPCSGGRNFVCDDGDLSPPLLKVAVTVTTTFAKWNWQFYQFFLILWARESYFSCYQKRSVAKKYAENAIAAGALPRTQLRELTMLPQTP